MYLRREHSFLAKSLVYSNFYTYLTPLLLVFSFMFNFYFYIYFSSTISATNFDLHFNTANTANTPNTANTVLHDYVSATIDTRF